MIFRVDFPHSYFHGSILLDILYSPYDKTTSSKSHLFVVTFIIYMVPIVRANPNGSEILQSYDEIASMVQAVGWENFIQSFKGHNVMVARSFAQSFNGKKAIVVDLDLLVTESFISKSTGFPPKGEKWFKNDPLRKIPWKQLPASKNTSYNIKGFRNDIDMTHGCHQIRLRFGLIEDNARSFSNDHL